MVCNHSVPKAWCKNFAKRVVVSRSRRYDKVIILSYDGFCIITRLVGSVIKVRIRCHHCDIKGLQFIRINDNVLKQAHRSQSSAQVSTFSYLRPAATVELKACIISWFCPYLGRSPSIYRYRYRRDGNTNDCVDDKHVATLASTLSSSVIRVAQRRLKCDGGSRWLGACRS